MLQYVQNRWIIFILLMCIINIYVPSTIYAEESVYDTYQQGATKGTDLYVDDEEKAEQPSELEDQIIGTAEKNEIGFWLFLKIIFYLVIILVMIYGLIKFLATKQKKLGKQQLFQHIGGTSLGSNKSLQLVKVGHTYYLLGVAEQINLIKAISDPAEIATLEVELEESENIMAKGFGQLMGVNMTSDVQGASKSFQHLFKNSLEKQQIKRANVEKEWDTYREREEDTSR